MRRFLTDFDTGQLRHIEVPVVVVGLGLAGLSTSLKLLELGIKPLIVAKKPFSVSNSFLAQGGIAAAISKEDSPQLHFEDTINAGRGICIEKNVRILVEEGLERIVDLINWGVDFDKDEKGNILLTKEGGHRKRRVLHIKDKTGLAIAKTLFGLIEGKADILEGYYLEEILTEDNTYRGIIIANQKEKIVIWSKALVLATGGYSPIYLRNTSAYNVGGDAISTAFRAGAVLKDLEFVQFHPTALDIEGEPAYLITEALRGEGAILVDDTNKRFVDEMKPRDEVARAIFKKQMEGKKVFLDISPLEKKGIKLSERFPTVYSLLKNYGMENSSRIPVSPAAHYAIGGIEADVNGKTSIEGMFAVGEVSCTGVHGANRLASNSLLECITFGWKTAYYVYIYSMQTAIKKIKLSSRRKSSKCLKKEGKIRYLKQIKSLMWNFVGLERSKDTLEEAYRKMEDIEEKLLSFKDSKYLLDMVYLSKAVILSAIERKETRGTHYRKDFPTEKDDYKKHSKIYNDFKIKMEVN